MCDTQIGYCPTVVDFLSCREVKVPGKRNPVAKLLPSHLRDAPRCGGQWRGQVKIAAGFEELPPDLWAAFATDR